MNDRQLHYILTIAEEKNLTAAARKLYISQPSLSNLLEHVETELGIRLFHRTPSGMVLTDAGTLYVQAARQILGILRDLDLKLDETREFKRGSLLVGCSHQLSTFIFPNIIPKMRRQFPYYTLNLHEDRMSRLQELLLSGHLDIAFLYDTVDIKGIRCLPFMTENVYLLAPLDFFSDTVVLRDGQPFLTDFSELKDKPFAIFKKGYHLRNYTEKIFHKNDFDPHIILETGNWQTCISMMESGEAFSILPMSPLTSMAVSSPDSRRFQMILLNDDFRRDLCICFRESLWGHPVVQAFIDICNSFSSAPV